MSLQTVEHYAFPSYYGSASPKKGNLLKDYILYWTIFPISKTKPMLGEKQQQAKSQNKTN